MARSELKPLPDMRTLETERLILRKLTMDDAEDVFAYASDPEMTRYVTWAAHRSIEDSREFLRRTIAQYDEGTPATWALVLRESGRVIGGISLRVINEWRAELGYVVAREHWGQGLMTEAARRIIDYGFFYCQLHRIEALCDVDHIGSARVMEKCGMQFEGILRGRAVLSGQIRDMRIHAILRDDWGSVEYARHRWGTLGSEEFVTALGHLSDQSGRRGWDEGARIIEEMRDRGEDPIPEALRNPDDRVRLLAVRSMQMLGDPRDFARATEMLKDPDFEVRVGAVYALESIDDPAAVDVLIPMLQDSAERVRNAASWILGWFAEGRAVQPLLERVRQAQPDEDMLAVWDALHSLCATSLPEVVAGLSDTEPRVRRTVAQALLRAVESGSFIVVPSVEERMGAAAEDNSEVMRAAVPALITALEDKDAQVREHVAGALGCLADDRALDALLHAASDQDAQVRASAVGALSELSDERAWERVLAAWTDPAACVRRAVAYGLGKHTRPEAIEMLDELLSDESPDVREDAVWGLSEGEGRDADRLREAAQEHLVRMAQTDPAEDVRYAAGHVLEKMREAFGEE